MRIEIGSSILGPYGNVQDPLRKEIGFNNKPVWKLHTAKTKKGKYHIYIVECDALHVVKVGRTTSKQKLIRVFKDVSVTTRKSCSGQRLIKNLKAEIHGRNIFYC